jgi:RNA polymerase sigma factor (sigma-70 family)
MTERFQNATETPDAELVRACRGGEKRAFVEIVARHQAMVCGVAFGILNDFAGSEDAAQEAFLTAWRKIQELREPDRLRAWLGQIARNAALAQKRRRRPGEELDQAKELSDGHAKPDEAAASEEEAQLVRESLERLPELYRLPLVLFYREGQSVRAVAESLGISEDAVKQRLARGREILRERMEGVIGRVLERSVPGAVFTMTIAVAIGALTAPSVIAASAFATAGTATTTSTSIVTAMSTTKAALATAALITVACIPVGYHFAGASASQPVAEREQTATKRSVERAKPTFENSVLFAEWRALHDKCGTNATAMPVLYQAIQDLSDSYRRRAFSSAQIAEWARIDGANGLAFFQKKKRNSEEAQEFFNEWFAVTPDAALNAVLSGEPVESEVARNSLVEIARRFPGRLPELVSRMAEPENFWESQVRDAFELIAEQDLRTGRESAEAVSGPNRDQALAGVARVWGKSNVDEAIAWAKGLPENTDRNEVIRGALFGKASVDPVGALDLSDIVPPAPNKPGYAHITTGRRVLDEAVKTDFEATVGWLVAHPTRLSRNDVTGMSGAIADRLNSDPTSYLQTWATEGALPVLLPAIGSALLNTAGGQRELVWEWLKTQPENDTMRALREEVLDSGAFHDLNTALKLAKDLPTLPEAAYYMKELAARLLNAGNDLHRFDTLYAEAPEPLKQPLLDQAFHYLSAETMDEKWLERLSNLPKGQRLAATESLARAWGARSPEEATAWVSSLSAVDERLAGAAGAADGIARKHPSVAAEWVASMEPGAEQDHAAGALVKRIAEDRPQEAWEWAGRINNAGERERAASYVVKQVAERNPGLAAEWLQSGPFTEKTRDDLRAALGLGGGAK